MPFVAIYTAALNVLLWLSHMAFRASEAGASSLARWGLVLLAPSALFAAALRALPSRRGPLAAVTAVSVGVVGFLG